MRGEAGETVDPETAAPDFSPKLMNHLLGGSARTFGTGSPFGLRQQTVLGIGEGALRRNQQHSVSSHSQSGSRFDGCGGAHLRLAHTQQRLFVAEVHLDIPALEISFDDLARVQFRIGADEVGRIAIKKLGAFAGAVGQGRNDNQLQNLLGSGGAPHNILEAFEAELMNYTGMREGHGLPGLGVVVAELLGSGGLGAIAKTAAQRFAQAGWRSKAQVGIFADTSDTSGAGRDLFEHGGVGETAVKSEY